MELERTRSAQSERWLTKGVAPSTQARTDATPGANQSSSDPEPKPRKRESRDLRSTAKPAAQAPRQGFEQELLLARQALADANRELASLRQHMQDEASRRNEMLAVIGHELRTPVTVIAGYSRLLLSEQAGTLNESQRRFLRESIKSCRFLNGFLENLLEASVPPEATPALEVRHAPLEPAIREVVSFLRPVLEERLVRVDLRLDDQVLQAAFDPARIEQVLLNLLGNAIRHARAGGRVEVTTSLRDSMGRRFVEVAVTDDGPGIPEKDRNRIFEPYQRADEGARGGLGLGLAICRSIVAAHGGTIAVSDGTTGGCRFAFTLPLPESFQGPESFQEMGS